MAQPFKIYNCEFGFKLNGVNYSFPDVDELQIEDPERNRLTRGSNASNKEGLVYRDGVKEPKRWTIPILNMSVALKEALDSVFNGALRIDVYCIDKTNGSAKWLRSAILCNAPQQLALDATPESMNVSLEFESYRSEEVLKD